MLDEIFRRYDIKLVFQRQEWGTLHCISTEAQLGHFSPTSLDTDQIVFEMVWVYCIHSSCAISDQGPSYCVVYDHLLQCVLLCPLSMEQHPHFSGISRAQAPRLSLSLLLELERVSVSEYGEFTSTTARQIEEHPRCCSVRQENRSRRSFLAVGGTFINRNPVSGVLSLFDLCLSFKDSSLPVCSKSNKSWNRNVGASTSKPIEKMYAFPPRRQWQQLQHTGATVDAHRQNGVQYKTG